MDYANRMRNKPSWSVNNAGVNEVSVEHKMRFRAVVVEVRWNPRSRHNVDDSCNETLRRVYVDQLREHTRRGARYGELNLFHIVDVDRQRNSRVRHRGEMPQEHKGMQKRAVVRRQPHR